MSLSENLSKPELTTAGLQLVGRPHGAIPSWLENVAEGSSMPLGLKKEKREKQSMAFPGCTRFPVICKW